MERLKNTAYTAAHNRPVYGNFTPGNTIASTRQSSSVSRQDWVELSENREEKAGLHHSISLLLKDLKNQYSDISITSETVDSTGLRQIAMQCGGGTHLIISQDFLNQMTESEAAFRDGRSVLTEILKQLSDGQPFYQASGAWLEKDQVTFWSVPQKEEYYAKLDQTTSFLQQFQQQNSTSSSSNKFHYSASTEDYNTVGKFNRLASASNKIAVQTIMGEAQSSIVSLRMVSCLGDADAQQKARSAIRALQKLLLRGRKKISRLEEEELMHGKKRKAHAQKQEEKERKIKAEIRKMEQKRRNSDNLIRKEGKENNSENLWQQKLLFQREEQLKQYESFCVDSMPTELSIDVSAGIVDAGMAAVDFSAAEVVVSPPISF